MSRADVRHDDCKQHCPVECPSGSSTHNTTGFFSEGDDDRDLGHICSKSTPVIIIIYIFFVFIQEVVH